MARVPPAPTAQSRRRAGLPYGRSQSQRAGSGGPTVLVPRVGWAAGAEGRRGRPRQPLLRRGHSELLGTATSGGLCAERDPTAKDVFPGSWAFGPGRGYRAGDSGSRRVTRRRRRDARRRKRARWRRQPSACETEPVRSMDMGNQHPSIRRLQEIQKEVKSMEQQVVGFSGLPNDKSYKNLERMLMKQLFEIDSVDTEGRGDVQQARKRAAQETERLLKELEQNASHPHRMEIQNIFQEAQSLVAEKVVPFYSGGACETEEFEEGIQDIILRLTHVKTGGKISLRKARHHTLAKVCAVQEIIEDCTGRRASLPLPEDAHPSVARINAVMCEVNKARGTLIALLMGVSGGETCRHLSCVLSGLTADLDALDVCGRTDVRNYRREVVEDINKLLKYLDLEDEADAARAFDLGQNHSIIEIEKVLTRMRAVKDELLRAQSPPELYLSSKTELQGLIGQLDRVSLERNPCIREARRRAVIAVQTLITHVDLKEALEKRKSFSGEEHPSHRAVWDVLGHLSEILGEVLSFDGNRTDKNYIRLEELLTKQLLALDAVDPQGEEKCKAARKQAVKLAQSILSYLDLKSDEWEY